MSEREKAKRVGGFRKVRAGFYVGNGYVIYRNQYGCWVIKQGGERLTHTTTLKAAQEWVAARIVVYRLPALPERGQ